MPFISNSVNSVLISVISLFVFSAIQSAVPWFMFNKSIICFWRGLENLSSVCNGLFFGSILSSFK